MQNLLMTAAEYGILMMTITQHVTWVQIPGGYRGYSPSKNFPGWVKCCISPQKMMKYAPSPKIASSTLKSDLHPWNLGLPHSAVLSESDMVKTYAFKKSFKVVRFLKFLKFLCF